MKGSVSYLESDRVGGR